MSWSVPSRSCGHTNIQARTCSTIAAEAVDVDIIVVVFFVALTFMLIANGVTNIIHWIKIRNSIASWEFQSWNSTEQFHDYSLKTQDWDGCVHSFAASRSMCGQHIANNANIPMRACDFYCCCCWWWCFFAFFAIQVNRILSIQRSKNDFASAKVAWQHPNHNMQSTSTFINYRKDFFCTIRCAFSSGGQMCESKTYAKQWNIYHTTNEVYSSRCVQNLCAKIKHAKWIDSEWANVFLFLLLFWFLFIFFSVDFFVCLLISFSTNSFRDVFYPEFEFESDHLLA